MPASVAGIEVDQERIRTMARRFGENPDASTCERLARLGRLLLQWNEHINLGGRLTPDLFIERHVVDSLASSRFVHPGDRVIDVGSGAGLPALPLALLRPTAAFELYEPTRKKVAFIRTAVRECSLSGSVRIHPERLSPSSAGESPFDVAISRATFPPGEWVRLGRGLVRGGGQVVVFATDKEAAECEGWAEEYVYGEDRRLLVFRN